MLKYLYSVLLLTHFSVSHCQVLEEAVEFNRKDKAARFAFYNVENLFDTIDDQSIDDSEFLPESEKVWNTSKYRSKVGNMAKTIRSIGGWSAPELVGLCEIENLLVLQDLVSHESLKQANYQIIHFDSDDPRGIDVGLLYKSDILTLIYAMPVKMRTENLRTRDILMAGFILPNKDTIHVFVNHWPSRRGGVTASEPKRMAAAEIITAKIDSLREMNPNIQLVVMGDFNDTPVNNSMQYLAEQGNLMNLMSKLPKNEGSHKYQGVWDYLDQLLVSPELLKQSSKSVVRNQSAYVFNYPYLLEQDDRYGDYFPLRTWKGNAFINGFSDHLPVFIDIIYAP